MVKSQFSFDDNELASQIMKLKASEVDEELQEVMKIWQACICDKLLPAVLDVNDKIMPDMETSECNDARMFYAEMTLVALKGSRRVPMFMFMNSADIADFSNFRTKSRAMLFEAVMSLATMFNGKMPLKFNVPMPGYGKTVESMKFGCKTHAVLSPMKEMSVMFPKCETLDEVVMFLAINGLASEDL